MEHHLEDIAPPLLVVPGGGTRNGPLSSTITSISPEVSTKNSESAAGQSGAAFSPPTMSVLIPKYSRLSWMNALISTSTHISSALPRSNHARAHLPLYSGPPMAWNTHAGTSLSPFASSMSYVMWLTSKKLLCTCMFSELNPPSFPSTNHALNTSSTRGSSCSAIGLCDSTQIHRLFERNSPNLTSIGTVLPSRSLNTLSFLLSNRARMRSSTSFGLAFAPSKSSLMSGSHSALSSRISIHLGGDPGASSSPGTSPSEPGSSADARATGRRRSAARRRAGGARERAARAGFEPVTRRDASDACA
mmetsp:Transcript_5923/g.23998  ORF Transcript_5923/g.23998 Transcript_5923/m.23998 type:complete len:304 (+) Transcript_5923:683-1594(+)